jgi:hypothetical protein
MALHLVSAKERLTYKGDDFQIYYRRVPSGVRAVIVKRHTDRRGNIDWSKVGDELVEYAITGWENVKFDGQPVEFAVDLVGAIPETIKGEIVQLASDNLADTEERELGNSPTTPVSSPTTTD